MPELPEIHSASKLINQISSKYFFGGKVIKSDVNKNCDIEWSPNKYSIEAKSRGKELMVTLQQVHEKEAANNQSDTLSILFHFGMSGVWRLTEAINIPKHAHLRFHTVEAQPEQVLSFIDTRRFGGWRISNEWSPDRGPDPVNEYDLFRTNILDNLDDSAFNKPICETLLNQKYFNGIGNYLRAEILFRAEVKPFEKARDVLQALNENEIKKENPDILKLCHDVPAEALNFDTMSAYYAEAKKEDSSAFFSWIRCYNNKNMKSMMDHNKRTIWFQGDSGPMVPKNRGKTKKRIKTEDTGTAKEEKPDKEVTSKAKKSIKIKIETEDNKPVKKAIKSSDVTTRRVTRATAAKAY